MKNLNLIFLSCYLPLNYHYRGNIKLIKLSLNNLSLAMRLYYLAKGTLLALFRNLIDVFKKIYICSKEIEYRLEQATQLNQELKSERDKLKERVKQSEENLAHQVKVTKNLELVLERIQNGKFLKYAVVVCSFWCDVV